MKKNILGLILLLSSAAFGNTAFGNSGSVKVVIDDSFEFHDGLVCDGGGCGLYNKKKAYLKKKRKADVEKMIHESLSHCGYQVILDDTLHADNTLHVKSKLVRGRYRSADYYGVYFDFYTTVQLELKDQINSTTIATVSANSRATTQDDRTNFKGGTYRKHKKALKKALSLFSNKCTSYE